MGRQRLRGPASASAILSGTVWPSGISTATAGRIFLPLHIPAIPASGLTRGMEPSGPPHGPLAFETRRTRRGTKGTKGNTKGAKGNEGHERGFSFVPFRGFRVSGSPSFTLSPRLGAASDGRGSPSEASAFAELPLISCTTSTKPLEDAPEAFLLGGVEPI